MFQIAWYAMNRGVAMNRRLDVHAAFSVFTITILILILPSTMLAQVWTSIGPYTGEVEQFWPSPLNESLLFVRGNLDGDPSDYQETGMSINGGVSFEPTYSLFELQFSQTDENRYWGITENSFYSHDIFGWEFTPLENNGGPESGRFLTKQPGYTDRFVLCAAMESSQRGLDLYTTADEGESWSLRYSSGFDLRNQFVDLEYDPFDTHALFAIRVGNEEDTHSRQFYRSSNAGLTWDPVGDIVYDLDELRFDMFNEGVAYVTHSLPSGVKRTMISRDGCATWSNIEGPNGEFGIKATQLSDGRLAVVTANGVFARSDPDAPWSLVSDEFDDSIFYPFIFEPYHFRVHPADVNMVFGMKDALVVRSMDMGATWSANTGGLTNPGQLVVKSCRADENTLLANTPKVLFLSGDRGESWRIIDTSLEINGAIHPANPDHIASWSYYRPAGQTGLRRSTDGGMTWENNPGINSVEDVAFHPTAEDVAWVLCDVDDGFGVYRTDDGFETWTYIPGSNDFISGVIADQVYHGDVYAYSPVGLARCDAGSDEFTDLYPGGGTILQVTLQPDGDGIGIRTDSYEMGLLSTNRGETFLDPIDYPMFGDGFEISWNGDLLLSSFGELRLSTDNGSEWEELLDVNQFIIDVEVSHNRTLYAGTEYSGILMLEQALGVEEVAAVDTRPISFSVLRAYPNPFNSATTITLTVDQPTTVRVDVFDMLGRRVERLANNQTFTAGQHFLTWEASRFASGTYVVQATNQTDLQSLQKITLTK
jgi:Secretion system C-terminal sorting domain